MMCVAKSYMARDDIMYRHIVPVTDMHDRSLIYRTTQLFSQASFQSVMGSGYISADTAVKVALWWIARGAQFVPVSYLPWAYMHYFKFWLLVSPVPAGDALLARR